MTPKKQHLLLFIATIMVVGGLCALSYEAAKSLFVNLLFGTVAFAGIIIGFIAATSKIK